MALLLRLLAHLPPELLRVPQWAVAAQQRQRLWLRASQWAVAAAVAAQSLVAVAAAAKAEWAVAAQSLVNLFNPCMHQDTKWQCHSWHCLEQANPKRDAATSGRTGSWNFFR